MSVSDKGLVLFVACVGVDALVLLFDRALEVSGMPTISEYVWARPWLGMPLVLFQGFLPVGLAVHFYASRTA